MYCFVFIVYWETIDYEFSEFSLFYVEHIWYWLISTIMRLTPNDSLVLFLLSYSLHTVSLVLSVYFTSWICIKCASHEQPQGSQIHFKKTHKAQSHFNCFMWGPLSVKILPLQMSRCCSGWGTERKCVGSLKHDHICITFYHINTHFTACQISRC